MLPAHTDRIGQAGAVIAHLAGTEIQFDRIVGTKSKQGQCPQGGYSGTVDWRRLGRRDTGEVVSQCAPAGPYDLPGRKTDIDQRRVDKVLRDDKRFCSDDVITLLLQTGLLLSGQISKQRG